MTEEKKAEHGSWSSGAGTGAQDTQRENTKHGTCSSPVDVGAHINKKIIPVSHLTPYETDWVIKVRATRKGLLRTYTKPHGDGHVFHVELADEDNTAIQACMFDDAALEFADTFKVGKTYLISKAKVHAADKRFSRLENNYELILNTNSMVKQITEANEDVNIVPSGSYDFVAIDHLEPYINTRTVIDVIGIISHVSSTMSIRRKVDNQEVPKREVTIEDQSGRSVRVTLWGDLALKDGQRLAEIVDEAPVVTLTSVKTTDFLGISLSTTGDTAIEINPPIAPAKSLRSWYDSRGKDIAYAPAGANLPRRHIMSDPMTNRGFLSDVISVHTEKIQYFNVRASISYIDPDQALWYDACKSCTKKVSRETDNFWCHTCQKNVMSNKRYILFAKLIDCTAETPVIAFNDEAEEILGHTADDLCRLKCQDVEQKLYRSELKKAAWMPKIFRLSVLQTIYMNRERQRITIRQITPIDWRKESNLLLQRIAELRTN